MQYFAAGNVQMYHSTVHNAMTDMDMELNRILWPTRTRSTRSTTYNNHKYYDSILKPSHTT
jgi:hypothetical protein